MNQVYSSSASSVTAAVYEHFERVYRVQMNTLQHTRHGSASSMLRRHVWESFNSRHVRASPARPRSATLYGPAARSKMAFEIDERESCNNVFGL
jgi:hypothetical protein